MITYIRLNIQPGDQKIEVPLHKTSLSSATHRIMACISTIYAGDMDAAKKDVIPDRSHFFSSIDIDTASVFSLCQKHTKDVVRIEKNNPPSSYQNMTGDGMIAQEKGIFLSITVADCLPVFLMDRKTGAFGIVHSGWMGTGIAGEAVRLMQLTYGSKSENIAAVIGPGIGVCCYNVPFERYRDFRNEFGSRAGTEKDGYCYIDLREANIALLQKTGVSEITVIENCTACSPELHSFRREGKEHFGRAIAVIGDAGAG